MSWYTVHVLETDGSELCQTEESSLRRAKDACREKLVEFSGYDVRKVEVRDERGQVVHDRFPTPRHAEAQS